MATYYVSATSTAGSPDGLTAATAYATLAALVSGKAIDEGDCIYIAPGTYREQLDCSAEGDGTAANPIKWIGDTNAEQFPGVEPGIVRITMADENEMPNDFYDGSWPNTFIVDLRNCEYHYLYNLYIDGTSAFTGTSETSIYGVYSNNSSYYHKLVNCHIQSCTIAVRQVNCYDCTFIACGYANLYAVEEIWRCTMIGGYYSVFNCGEIVDCVLIGGGNMAVYNSDTVTGCTIACARIGLYSTSTTDVAFDNHLIGIGQGVQGQNTTKMHMSGSRIDGGYFPSNKGVWNRIEFGGGNSRLGGSNASGGTNTIVLKPQVLWTQNQVREMGNNIAPKLYNKPLQGIGTTTLIKSNGTIYTPTYARDIDITGKPRSMGIVTASNESISGGVATTVDVGAFEYSNIYLSSSMGGEITASIEDAGQFVIPIAVASASSLTISADVKWESSTMTQKPQLILRQSPTEPTSSGYYSGSSICSLSGSVLELCNVTHPNATTNNWETLTVSSSIVPKDTQLELVLFSRNTGSASTSSIANIFVR